MVRKARRRTPRSSEAVGWPEIGLEAWALGIDASAVVGLRLARLAGGGPSACTEAQLMVTEKVESGMALASALVAGKLGTTPREVLAETIAHYRKGVSANRRRLGKR